MEHVAGSTGLMDIVTGPGKSRVCCALRGLLWKIMPTSLNAEGSVRPGVRAPFRHSYPSFSTFHAL